MFNPGDEASYREVISRWVVMLLVLLDEVAADTASHALEERGARKILANVNYKSS